MTGRKPMALAVFETAAYEFNQEMLEALRGLHNDGDVDRRQIVSGYIAQLLVHAVAVEVTAQVPTLPERLRVVDKTCKLLMQCFRTQLEEKVRELTDIDFTL